MRITQRVKKILNNYTSDSPGTKASLARILGAGKLGGSGKTIILPVDQGFEHGPDLSFGMNADAYDPTYHHKLAIDAGLSAYAAPLGMLELTADSFAGEIPTILKINSANKLIHEDLPPTQAITGSIQDAIHLGCAAIGYTIYPGSDDMYGMYEELRELAAEAKASGLAVVVWSYPRGNMSKQGETAIDTIAYGAHVAALLGGHIIKVKLPTDHVESKETKEIYTKQNISIKTLTDRVAHLRKCCFEGKRLVVFSGGGKKGDKEIMDEARAIRDGGGNGSIIGRNVFQRPRQDALALLKDMVNIYLGK